MATGSSVRRPITLNSGAAVSIGYAWADDAAPSTTSLVPPLVRRRRHADHRCERQRHRSLRRRALRARRCLHLRQQAGRLASGDERRSADERPRPVCIASTRGNPSTGGISGVQHMGPIVKFMDDATASSATRRCIERRQFDFRGGNYLARLGGITKLVHVIDIGHSLTIGGTAGLLTTAPFFNRGVMFNGGPKVVQRAATANGTRPRRSAPTAIMASCRALGISTSSRTPAARAKATAAASSSGRARATLPRPKRCCSPRSARAARSWPTCFPARRSSPTCCASPSAPPRLAALNGWGWECYVTCSIGENDYLAYATNASGFQTNLIALQAAIQTAIQTIFTAQGWTVPTYIPLDLRAAVRLDGQHLQSRDLRARLCVPGAGADVSRISSGWSVRNTTPTCIPREAAPPASIRPPKATSSTVSTCAARCRRSAPPAPRPGSTSPALRTAAPR